jgi:hypothetical protein
MTNPRRHHSVPQFLLAGFAKKKGKIWQTNVFDKLEGRTFRASIRDVMVERDFNAIQLGQEVVSLEEYISRVEDITAPIVRKLVEAESAALLSDSDRENLAVFVALQLVRGTGHRAQYLNTAQQIRDALIRRGLPEDDARFSIPDDHMIKMEALHTIATSLPQYSVHLRRKDFVVFKAPEGHEFLIGDNPIALDNHKDFGFRGNLGIAVEGIEVYLPLTSRYTLGMWATDLRSELREMLADVRKKNVELRVRATLGVGPARELARRSLEKLEGNVADAEQLLREVEAGGPVLTHPESMDRFNSMQVAYAERYVASMNGNFTLPRQMIAEHPEIRARGARTTVR